MLASHVIPFDVLGEQMKFPLATVLAMLVALSAPSSAEDAVPLTEIETLVLSEHVRLSEENWRDDPALVTHKTLGEILDQSMEPGKRRELHKRAARNLCKGYAVFFDDAVYYDRSSYGVEEWVIVPDSPSPAFRDACKRAESRGELDAQIPTGPIETWKDIANDYVVEEFHKTMVQLADAFTKSDDRLTTNARDVPMDTVQPEENPTPTVPIAEVTRQYIAESGGGAGVRNVHETIKAIQKETEATFHKTLDMMAGVYAKIAGEFYDMHQQWKDVYARKSEYRPAREESV